ncbi:MAG: hypothetical protein ABIA62_01455 [Candidatus Woesearchaeota archaeon]
MAILSTLIIGNRQTDALLDIPNDYVAMERFQLLDEHTFEEKCQNPDSFLTDQRTLRFLEMRGLLQHSSPHKYRVINGYRVALSLIASEKQVSNHGFDTVFVYRLVDANGKDYSSMSHHEADTELSSRMNARRIVESADGLVVLIAKQEKDVDLDSPVDVYQHKVVQEIKRMEMSNVIISYARSFVDVIALNNDIGKNPAVYRRARKTRVLNSVEDYLNKNL